MLQNYQYFITLAETLNISHAAQKLYISHQCLSRYLKTLEHECGLTLFERKPAFTLTYAGQTLLEAFREIERIEKNAEQSLEELRTGNSGEIHFGITEGRLRIFFPDLLKRFQEQFPDETLKAVSAPTSEMLDMLLENKLDLVLGGLTRRTVPTLDFKRVMDEDLYLVVSDNLLRTYFAADYPACKEAFIQGADLRLFEALPFTAAHKGFNSRTILDEFLQTSGISLNIVYEANQPDLLHILTSNDYACSFCLSMYLPNIKKLNQMCPPNNQLNVFPIKGLTAKNSIFLISQKGKYFPQYTKSLIKLVRQMCKDEYSLPRLTDQ